MIHHLPVSPATVVETVSRDSPPVLTVQPGDTVVLESLDSGGHLERQTFPGEDRPRMFTPRRGHCLTGPVAVDGARPGDVLAVHFSAIDPGPWGWTASGGADSWLNHRLGLGEGHGGHLLWEVDTAAGLARSHLGYAVPLAPFLGVVGVACDVDGELSTVPPRPESGGNMDCRDLVAGSTLFLPVNVPGALLTAGDGHAAQGHGEVGGTAIECPMTTTMALDVVVDPPLRTVHALTPTARLTLGFDTDLNTATAAALDAMVTWMESLLSVTRAEALGLSSAAVDLHVTQVANQTWGVHASLGHEALLRG
ncbi:acetamidase [Phycicoccus sp. Root563]|uniref:acetamidase/formamidase family protein n=1 Tax=Phycicoccus sp. Root563 TaxID=1736562 RepID=UPI000702D439|nr:acetamidase/formamidase family protein [Phycicoccus sp. Root563]KQZ90848.1 acetamidase [Phycicoccus sp. Root563]